MKEFNPHIDITEEGEIMKLLKEFIEHKKPNSKYSLQFHSNENIISLHFKGQLEIYPYKWEFLLEKVN